MDAVPASTMLCGVSNGTPDTMHEARSYFYYAFTYRYSYGGRRAGRTSCARVAGET